MKKQSNVFKKIFVGGIMTALLAIAGTAMACENDITQISKVSFDNGSMILTYKGDYADVMVDTRKAMWKALEKHSSPSYFLELNVDKQQAISHVIIVPNTKEIIVEKTIVAEGNLDEIDQVIARRNDWVVEYYDGEGHWTEPTGEAMLSKVIK